MPEHPSDVPRVLLCCRLAAEFRDRGALKTLSDRPAGFGQPTFRNNYRDGPEGCQKKTFPPLHRLPEKTQRREQKGLVKPGRTWIRAPVTRRSRTHAA